MSAPPICRVFYLLLVQQVASEQPLRNNISTNSSYLSEFSQIRWKFKRCLTGKLKTIFDINITNSRVMSLQNYDGRISLKLEDQPNFIVGKHDFK